MKQRYSQINGNLNKATNRHIRMYISYFMEIIDARSYLKRFFIFMCIRKWWEYFPQFSSTDIWLALTKTSICTLSIFYFIMQMIFWWYRPQSLFSHACCPPLSLKLLPPPLLYNELIDSYMIDSLFISPIICKKLSCDNTTHRVSIH